MNPETSETPEMSPAPPNRTRPVLFAVGAALLLAGIAWSILHKPAGANVPGATSAKATPPVAATTVRVRQQTVPIFEAGIGTVTPNQSVIVKARIDGQLDQVGFTEGQDVKAGQMLARIDPRTLQAQLEQVQAQRAKDAAQLANAKVDLQRYTTLIAQDAATQQQLDTQRALVAQLEAAVKTDDAQIHFAQVQLGFTTISAPISGRVGARLVDVGNIVHAADTTGLVVINQIDPISVVFTLPEEAFQRINRALQASHQPLAVRAYARSGDEVLGTGTLTLLNNQIDTATGTVQLKGSFPNPQHKLWPGQFVNVRLVLGDRENALTVPAAVVQRSQQGTYAYVVNDGDNTVQPQEIKVAQIQDGLAVIDEGLKAGDRVVLDGQYKLKPGARIVESGGAPQGVAVASAAPVPTATPASAPAATGARR
jgi:multidrug efflux system membrane fusion protein